MASVPGAGRLIRTSSLSRIRSGLAAAFITWACVPACAAESTVVPDIGTEPGLRVTLDEIEASYEKVCQQTSRSRWDLTENPSPAAVQRFAEARSQMGEVFASNDLDRVLQQWASRNTVATDPTLTRRVRIWDMSRRGARIESDPLVFRLSSDLIGRMLTHVYRWEGKPIESGALERIIASVDDPAKRRAAWSARLTLATAVARDMRELVRTRALRARATPSIYYHHVVMGSNDVRPDWLYTVLEVLSRSTNPAYEKLVSALEESSGLPALAEWDIDYAMNRLSARRHADEIDRRYFPASGVVPAVSGLLKGLGFNPDELPLKLVPSDSVHGVTDQALSIPGDYRILVGTGAGGADLYEQTFRAVGRGLLAVLNERPAPMLKGYDCTPGTRNGPYAEAMAEALAGFLYDPLFLRTQMKMSPDEVRLFVQDRLDRRLIEFRRQILHTGMDYVLYVNPDADLDGRYATLHFNALRVPVDRDLAASWSGDIEVITNPVHSVDSIIGAAIGRELHRKLETELGEARLGSGRAAAWLIERCFKDGEDLPLEERIARAVDSGYEFERFTDWLTGATSEKTK